MKKELNIAAILKDKPKGTKLYSTPFGDCTFDNVANDDNIRFTERSDAFYTDGYGKYSPNGECLVFPSKQMQDWSKFAWKKGDVLADEERFVIFKGFENDDYTEFFAPFEYNNNTFRQDLGLITNEFRKANDDIAQEVIKRIEEHYGGKLNLETLEIEKPKQEFKDGDIITIEDTEYKAIIIYKSNGDCMFRSYAVIDNAYKKLGIGKTVNALGRCTRLATNSEKQQLFSALAKEGKAWDAEKKQIVDLKPKVEFKPFDKVLVRNTDTEEWFPGFFEKFDITWNYPYHIMNRRSMTDFAFKQCIPYNEETKHLLGTTDEWKGGK